MKLEVRRKEERYRGHGRSVEVMQTGRWSNGYGRESIEGGKDRQTRPVPPESWERREGGVTVPEMQRSWSGGERGAGGRGATR